MILIVTSKTDYTADFLILALKRRGIDFVRFNTEDFPSKVTLSVDITKANVVGFLEIGGRIIDLQQIKVVWYRRPLISEASSEITDINAIRFIQQESYSTLENLWQIISAFWVSHPTSIRTAESKLYQLVVAAKLGFNTPHTLITNHPIDAISFYKNSASIVYKPLRQAEIPHGEYNYLIFTNRIEQHHLQEFDRIKYAPTLFQSYVEKYTELRVTVVGNQTFPVEIFSQDEPMALHDWRRTDIAKLQHRSHKLPIEIDQMCVELTRVLGLEFSAIDLIRGPDNAYVFLEVNPNGQWAWVEQLCPEIKIADALIDLFVTHDQ